ncbi:MAG: hypothetical protein ACMG6E_00785 [Candidatus Roizmanbacteria bacterium]
MAEPVQTEEEQKKAKVYSRYKEIVDGKHPENKTSTTTIIIIVIVIVIILGVGGYFAYRKKDEWFPNKKSPKKENAGSKGNSGSKITVSSAE